MKRVLVALMVVATVAASAQTDAKKDVEKLRGTWTVSVAEGKPLPVGVHSALVITGDKYQGISDGKVDESGMIKVDGSTSPMSVDFLIGQGKDAGKIQLGLADVKDDTLTLILGEPGATARPDPGSPNKLILTRIKPLAKELEGSWEGALDAGGQSLRLVVKLSNGTDGLATGTMVSVDQGSGDIPLAAVIQSGARLRFIVPSVRGGYEGELKDGQLVGTWSQGAASLPLTLKRAK